MPGQGRRAGLRAGCCVELGALIICFFCKCCHFAEMERRVGGMVLGFSSCQADDYSSAEEEDEDRDIKEWEVEDELTDESSC